MEIRRLREERIKMRRMDKEETRRSRNGETESEGERRIYEPDEQRDKGKKKMEEKENEMGIERVYREERKEEKKKICERRDQSV